jgi:hypothetical protein
MLLTVIATALIVGCWATPAEGARKPGVAPVVAMATEPTAGGGAASAEELGGLSDPGSQGCVHQGVYIGLGDRTCPVPYLCCILPACGVELVDTEGNYSSCT